MLIVNPNKEYVKQMREKIEQNNFYCPCSLLSNVDTICVCKEVRENGGESCHCKLFIGGQVD